MANDPILPPDDPAPAPEPAPMPAPARRRGNLIECEFCQCMLTQDGEVMKRGDVARRYLDMEDKIRALKEQIEALESELAAARSELAALKGAERRRWWE